MKGGRRLLLIAAVAVLLSVGGASAAAQDADARPSQLWALQTARQGASTKVLNWALACRVRSIDAWRRWNRARACFGAPRRPFLSPRIPHPSSPYATWLAAAFEWQRLRHLYRERTDLLRYRMTHPTGNGVARWRPLVRWHWPAHLVERALWVMSLESGGDPTARNRYSGAIGLFQLYPAPSRGRDPDYNVWYAYWCKYRPAGGFSPWVVTH